MIELKELKEKPALKSQRTQTQVPERTLLGVCASGAKATLITLSAILLSWACVEFIFAATHVGEDTVAKPDPLLGYSHLEGQTITFRSEGYSQSTINMEGFRDKLYAVPKPAGVKRVCVVGDSMTMGLEVPLASTYPKMLEKRLQSEGKNVEVINCGMSGTGTGQQYLGWRQKIAALQPDMLIVGYHLGDTDDNVGGGTNPPRPTFLVDSQNKLTIDFKDVDSWFASENSRFYSSFAWFRRNSRILAVLSKLDLDLQADPAYKLVMKAAGKAKASAWNAFLKCLPQGDWQIPQSRDIVTDLLPSPPASASPITVGATPCVAQVNGSPASAGTGAGGTPALPDSKTTAASTDPQKNLKTSNPNPGAPASRRHILPNANVVPTKAIAAPLPAATPSTPTPPPVVPSAEHGQQDIDLYHGMIWMHNSRMAVTKEILRRLNNECRAKNCQLVIAGLPAYNNTIIYYRELNEIREMAQKEGFTYIDAWRAYPSRGPLDESPYHFSTHFNCAGHKIMSDTLYNSLFKK